MGEWLMFKEEGNNLFKSNKYEQAIASYTKALNQCEGKDDRTVLYRNRSVCYLKLEKYEEAFSDADAVLKENANDVKALFRRCQASEALGKLESSFKDVKRLIQLEPKNTAIQEAYRRITAKAQEKITKSQSTSNMISEMVDALSNSSETPERRKQALKNLAIYAHQSGGRDILIKGGYLQKLIPVLSNDAESASCLMKICHGFCENNFKQTLQVVSILAYDQMRSLILKFSDNIDCTVNTLTLVAVMLKCMVDQYKMVHKLSPEDETKNFCRREKQEKVRKSLEEMPQYVKLLNFLVGLLSDSKLPSEGRDAVLDAFVKAIGYHKAVSDFIIANKGVRKMVELATLSSFAMVKQESPLPVNEKTYIHVSVALSLIYEKVQYFDKQKEEFEEQLESVINSLIDSDNTAANLQALVALSTIIMASRESGQRLSTKNDNISKVMVLACKEDAIVQMLAAEVMALAASDKTVCNAIAEHGLDILQMLYTSDDSSIRVRGLVAMCKVCMKGSGNVRDKILADDGADKLYKTCRKFLLSTKKAMEMKKWACEGLAYLTLDADVKEMLVNDTEALNALLDLAKSEDSTVTYGVCNALVNLTNSYDKPEKNPELEQIAKFAKQPVPEQHEKDTEEYVKSRVDKLVANGLITALVNLSNVRSENTKEMMARVFGAIADDVARRGKIVAQGGVKTLLPLALEGTEKGQDYASQALAKIAITNDPRLAFTGQRCMEVVRPLVKMLHFRRAALLRFEGLMALTNLASMNDEVRKRIMKENGFQEVEALIFEDDEELKRAATECMCNLVLNEEAFNMFKDDSSPTERVKLMTLLSGEESPELSRAASGTLAILTSDLEICRTVVKVSSHLEILKYLLTSENVELRHRGLYVVANLIESEREIAEKVVEDELFEVLLALKVTPTNNENVKRELKRCFDAAEKLELIRVNPEN